MPVIDVSLADNNDAVEVSATDSVVVSQTLVSNDYNVLINKPQIAGVTLTGNKSLSDLGITNAIDTQIASKGYQTSAQVESAITSKGYQTSQQVENAITNKGYQTAQQVENAITSKGYQTASQVNTTVANATNGKISESDLDGTTIYKGTDNKIHAQGGGGGGASTWGQITGTLSNQTDLQNALNSKANTSDIPSLSGYATETYVNNHHDSTKQNTLVSGTNIKTVNNTSLLGSGNISIPKGDDGFSPNCVVEQTSTGAVIYCTDADGTTTANISNGTNGNDGTSCTHSWNGTTLTVTSASGTSSADLKGATGDDGQNYEVEVVSTTYTEVELQANKFMSMGEMAELYISLGDPVSDDVLSEYMFTFTSGDTATDFSYDIENITFIDEPDIQANTVYQGSIVNGIAIMVGLAYE